MAGLYVHVPFCASKCAYCDFYSLAGKLDLVSPYVDAVLTEAQACAGMSFDTLYLGGGTPSVLGVGNVETLIRGLKDVLDLSRLAEATIEVNPESARGDLLQAAMDLGFTRVSVGVQSLSDRELRNAGRVHSAEQAVEAVSRVVGMGFPDVSADVIVGLPGQTGDSLQRTLEELAGMGVSHLSVYCLSLEDGTPLAADPPDDLPSDDLQADLFEGAGSVLGGRGFIHYEISNFCEPGRECRHNLNYWRGGEYRGLGPAAASHLGGHRWKNRADLPAYLCGPGSMVDDVEDLDLREKAAEEAMLRLRLLVEGLAAGEMVRRFGDDATRELLVRLSDLAADGLLTCDGATYRLPRTRVLTSNLVLARVLA